ncbi:hypothetical protein F5880DRAFT_1443947, partial [Lentinula raphanica]
LSGNSANAQVVAKNDARKLAVKHRQLFLKFVPSLHNILHEGGVTLLRPLRLSDWGFVYLESANGIFVAQVLAMYTRGGGKNGKHNSVDSTTGLAGLSHIAVQIFEFSAGSSFRILPELMAPFSTKAFALMPPQSFLTTLEVRPTSRSEVSVRISKNDTSTYQSLVGQISNFQLIMKEYRKR